MQENPTAPIAAGRKCPYDISWEKVTPTRAMLWLKNTWETDFTQRSISNSTVEKYAGEMKHDGWFEASGDSILISEHGGHECCLNGQHRLKAIVDSGMPLNTLVLRNVPAEAFKHVDQGAERTLKHVMDAAKFRNAQDMQTTVKNLWKFDMTGNPLENPPYEDMLSPGNLFDWAMDKHGYLEGWYESWKGDIRKAAKANRVPPGTLAYMFLQWQDCDRDRAKAWIEYLTDPSMKAAPSCVLAKARDHYVELKLEAQANGMNKGGHWADLTLACHQTYNLAWNLTVEGSGIRTIPGFRKALVDLGRDLPELVGAEARAA